VRGRVLTHSAGKFDFSVSLQVFDLRGADMWDLYRIVFSRVTCTGF